VLSVHDTCGGIPDEEIDRVFDLAFRGDAARTPGDGGGGFGLAIARGLVEAHHGDIAVANDEGGCRFTVRLPLEP
jgi:signal transduction histidine kinase